MKFNILFSLLFLLISTHYSVAADEKMPDTNGGTFYHMYWYEDGVEHGNPKFNSRFRVNSPSVVLHPTFGKRVETKGNGMMQILIDEDLSLLDGAELYLEVWGGHPHTENKRVTINGRSTYYLPEVGTKDGHCTHMYPTIPIKITDLVNGYNVLQFACDEGDSFWGHFIVENACLRLQLNPEHPKLTTEEIDRYPPNLVIDQENENIYFSIDHSDNVKSVDYQARYIGYDENGDGVMNDWHGFTKGKIPVGFAQTFTNSDHTATWNTSMIPMQHNISVRAWIMFEDDPKLLYLTQETPVSPIGNKHVRFYAPNDIPVPFWSRAERLKTCTITIDIDPNSIQSAILQIVVWDGGSGNVDEYFKLNGHPIKVAKNGSHDVLYKEIEIDPSILKKGVNSIELFSDTKHHGIEILLPGPAIAIKLSDL